MMQIKGMAAAALAALAALAAAPAQAQLQEPDFSVAATDLGDGLYLLAGRGGNIGVSAGADGTFLIDDQYAPATPAINAALGKLGVAPVRFVINTHWHGDHTGGNENFGKAGAVIIAHDNVRGRMSVPQQNRFLDGATPAAAAAALPVITFGDALNLHLNGQTIRALHAPRAHTDGDTVVHFTSSNVLHAGDIFFNGRYPFIDVDSGGSIAGLLAAVDLMLAASDDATRIIPGHGPLADRVALQAYRDMLAETSARVAKLLDEGRSVEQIIAAAPNADYDATWAWAFITAERYVRMLVGLAQAPPGAP